MNIIIYPLLGRKQPKTLSGIETWTPVPNKSLADLRSRKQPKTLSGIETPPPPKLSNYSDAPKTT